MRRAGSLIGLAALLAASYWHDRWVLPGLRDQAATFDVVPLLWTEAVAHLLAALAVVGLIWLVFGWSPPSRLVGFAYLIVGAVLLLAWPLAATYQVEVPGFATLGLWGPLGDGSSMLSVVAPFLVAIGLARLVVPLPSRQAIRHAIWPVTSPHSN